MSINKHAFVVYAGPAETGRVFHALTHAKQAHALGDQAKVYFAAEGTYWPGALSDSNHPMHGLFNEVSSTKLIEGACENCAVAFGNKGSAESACGLVRGPVESYGQIDILGLDAAGWRVWLF